MHCLVIFIFFVLFTNQAIAGNGDSSSNEFCTDPGGQKNSWMNTETHKLLIPSLGYKVSGKGRLYFHTAPFEGCREKSLFVVPGDSLEAHQEFGGWTLVEFTAKKNTQIDVSGWVKTDRLQFTGTLSFTDEQQIPFYEKAKKAADAGKLGSPFGNDKKGDPAPDSIGLENAVAIQKLGQELGFDIPLTRKNFLERYAESGGACGESKFFKTMTKSIVPTAVSECWTSSKYSETYSQGLNSILIRTAYDDRENLVLYQRTFRTLSSDPIYSVPAMRKVTVNFKKKLGDTAPTVRDLPNGTMAILGGYEGNLRYEANLILVKGEPQTGLFFVNVDNNAKRISKVY